MLRTLKVLSFSSLGNWSQYFIPSSGCWVSRFVAPLTPASRTSGSLLTNARSIMLQPLSERRIISSAATSRSKSRVSSFDSGTLDLSAKNTVLHRWPSLLSLVVLRSVPLNRAMPMSRAASRSAGSFREDLCDNTRVAIAILIMFLLTYHPL